MDILAVFTIVSVPAAVVLGAPPLWLEYRRSRTHVRLVSASIDRIWQAEEGDFSRKLLIGGELAVVNAGQYPVRNLIIMEPSQLLGTDVKLLGPSERFVIQLPKQLVSELDTEPPIVMQIEDVHRKLWRWSPTNNERDPIPPKLTPLARLVQSSAKVWPKSWHTNFSHLPKTVQRILWGYLPSGDH